MDSQPSTSSGAMDQCRKDALKSLRGESTNSICLQASLIIEKMRSHEASSESLMKDCSSTILFFLGETYSNYLYSQVLSEGIPGSGEEKETAHL
jgi:hypothetical protein